MPARPEMLICFQNLDDGIGKMLVPHVIQDHKVSHRKVFIQATGGIGDLDDQSRSTQTRFMSCLTNDCVYTHTLHESDRECDALN